MAHLGRRDRKDPQNPVFVRYITNNKDWEKLTIKTENGQFADMYRKEGTSLVEMDIRINPRTEVKLLKNDPSKLVCQAFDVGFPTLTLYAFID